MTVSPSVTVLSDRQIAVLERLCAGGRSPADALLRVSGATSGTLASLEALGLIVQRSAGAREPMCHLTPAGRELACREADDEPSHDDRFAQFTAERDSAAAATIRVTWRKVSDLTGGGHSGLGPGGTLVYVGPRTAQATYEYGRVAAGGARIPVATVARFSDAKSLAAALFTTNPQTKEKRTMAKTATAKTTAAPAAAVSNHTDDLFESLMAQLPQLAKDDKGRYVRLFRGSRSSGRCVAWVHRRRDGIRVDVRIQPNDLTADLRKGTEAGVGSFGVRVPVKDEKGIPFAVATVQKAVEVTAAQ